MKLVVPPEQTHRLQTALESAGVLEIGGQLFGEQIAPSYFRVTDLVVQARRGSLAAFIVDVCEAGRSAIAFFHRTGHDYLRHNYIGEWHSHPSFAVAPSSKDASTMEQLVAAPDFAGSFAILLIARLEESELQAGAWLYDPVGHTAHVALELQTSGSSGDTS